MDYSFLEQPRKVTSGWHFIQLKKWIEFDNGRELDSVLVYASLEARSAIERYWMELLALISSGVLTPEQEKHCESKKGLLAEIQKAEPDIAKRIEFSNAALAFYPFIPNHPTVDMKYLIRSWHKLSDYCHKQLRPGRSWESPKNTFQKAGFVLLKDLVFKLGMLLGSGTQAILSNDDLAPEIADLYSQYMNGEVNINQVKRQLEIMEPVLLQRYRNRQ